MTTATAMTASATRPEKSEYLPYYERYIARVPDGDVVATLTDQIGETLALLRSLPASVSTYRYAPDKWSVNELVGHVIDSERLFTARALRFARNDSQPLPGFEQDDFVAASGSDRRTLADLVAELEHLRAANLVFFRSLEPAAWERTGTASNNPFVVCAFPYIIAGHEAHHRRVLAERYL